MKTIICKLLLVLMALTGLSHFSAPPAEALTASTGNSLSRSILQMAAVMHSAPINLDTHQVVALSGYGGDVSLKFSNMRTYSVTTPFFTTANNATDVGTLPGNASNTVYLLACYVTITPTVAGQCNFFLTKRSTANTSGTSSTDTGIPQDSADSSAVSSPKRWTANPTTGTLVGNVAGYSWYSNTAGASGQPVTIPLYVAGPYAKPVTCRGTAESINVNQNGVTNPVGTSTSITWVWGEK